MQKQTRVATNPATLGKQLDVQDIEPTAHEKSEWYRMALHAYSQGYNSVGHKFSCAAAMRAGDKISLRDFDLLQYEYRNWLCFNELKQ